MLTTTGGKDKHGSPSKSLANVPSFRFNKADEAMVEILEGADSMITSVAEQAESQLQNVVSTSPPSLESFNLPDMSDMAENHFKESTPDSEGEIKGPASLPTFRPEPSPIKEALLTKFAKLAPASSSDDLLGASPNSSMTERSWLRQVKGKIAKTVEEKYTEYKQEKEMKRQMAQNSGAAASTTPDSDLIDVSSGVGINSDPKDVCILSHSQSVGLIEGYTIESSGDLKSSHSVDFSGTELLRAPDEEERLMDDPKTPTPDLMGAESNSNESAVFTPSEEMLTPTPASISSPSRSRKRFTFPSFQSLRSSPAKAEVSNVPAATADLGSTQSDTEQCSTNATSAPIPTGSAAATPTPLGETPSKSSLRSRMWNLMGKSPAPGGTPPAGAVKEPNISVSMKELCNEEPFPEDLPGGLMVPDDPDDIEVALEATEFHFEPSTREELDGTTGLPEYIVDAEIIRMRADSPEITWLWGKDGDLKYWWIAGLPICVLLFLQILPLPNWLIGFITGILIGVPVACYATYYFVKGAEEVTITPFIDNIQQKVAKKPAIIVQEEIQRKFTWMNLWPTRKGPYDPLTYDVRCTSSVRIMLHGPWIEMRFPKRNLPLRRMHDDVEPKKIEFHDQVEVVDLSVCSVDLLPENLPSKRQRLFFQPDHSNRWP